MIDGMSLTIGGATGAAIVSAIVKIWTSKAHAEKTAIPQPCTVEQSGYQAKMKENDKAHENLFSRVAIVEQKLAAVDAKVDAKFSGLEKQLDGLTDMVRQLFERICGGKKK